MNSSRGLHVTVVALCAAIVAILGWLVIDSGRHPSPAVGGRALARSSSSPSAIVVAPEASPSPDEATPDPAETAVPSPVSVAPSPTPSPVVGSPLPRASGSPSARETSSAAPRAQPSSVPAASPSGAVAAPSPDTRAAKVPASSAAPVGERAAAAPVAAVPAAVASCERRGRSQPAPAQGGASPPVALTPPVRPSEPGEHSTQATFERRRLGASAEAPGLRAVLLGVEQIEQRDGSCTVWAYVCNLTPGVQSLRLDQLSLQPSDGPRIEATALPTRTLALEPGELILVHPAFRWGAMSGGTSRPPQLTLRLEGYGVLRVPLRERTTNLGALDELPSGLREPLASELTAAGALRRASP